MHTFVEYKARQHWFRQISADCFEPIGTYGGGPIEMNFTDQEWRFVMLQLKDGALGGFVQEIAERKLQLRDAALYLALMAHTDTYSGRIYVTADQLAEDLNCTPSEARAGIGRLKRVHQLRLIVEPGTGRRYYLLNPWVVQSGKPPAIGLAMKQFQEA